MLFFHPTFQEYFAALAIDDWHYFLNHIPENPSHPDAKYRIFEAQWKEVFLLWLGRKHIFKEEKENFINALVKFEDRCNGFYWEQAVLIAAEGIAEFKGSIYEIKIVEQLILWAFGYFDFQKQQWLEALNPLTEEARKALLETNHSLVIKQIIDFIQDYPDGLYARYRAIQILGEIGSGYPEVVQLLADLLCNSQDKRTVVQTAETLARIVPNHQEAITILLKLLEDEKYSEYAAKSLREVQSDSQEIISLFIEIITRYQLQDIHTNQAQTIDLNSIESLAFPMQPKNKNEKVCGLAIECLGDIGVGNHDVINMLLKLLNQNENRHIRCKVVESLGKIGKGNLVVGNDLYSRW